MQEELSLSFAGDNKRSEFGLFIRKDCIWKQPDPILTTPYKMMHQRQNVFYD